MTIKNTYITTDYAGQRLDNFLIRSLKGVPKSRIYRAIRNGEVRINAKRCQPEDKLSEGDHVRIPPMRVAAKTEVLPVSSSLGQCIESRILIENNELIVLHKPAGIPVHGGTEVSLGLIEALRQLRPKLKFLELVHRLDKDTSGCLLIAKKRATLIELQSRFKTQRIQKRYWVLVKGRWQGGTKRCDLPLVKNHLEGGERIVRVDRDGMVAVTVFRPIRLFETMTLLEATLKTGRTHQIRVHLQALGYPIAGDTKYGDRDFNRFMAERGLKRMFLQCVELSYCDDNALFGVCALLDAELQCVLF